MTVLTLLLLSACGPGQPGTVSAPPHFSGTFDSKSYAYNGLPQFYFAPPGVKQLLVTLNGGAGGYLASPPALGAQVTAKLAVSDRQIFLVFVGQVGGAPNCGSYQGTIPGGLSSGSGFIGGAGGAGSPAGGSGGGATVIVDYASNTVLMGRWRRRWRSRACEHVWLHEHVRRSGWPTKRSDRSPAKLPAGGRWSDNLGTRHRLLE